MLAADYHKQEALDIAVASTEMSPAEEGSPAMN